MVTVHVLQHPLDNYACVESQTNTDMAKHEKNCVHVGFVCMCGIPHMRLISLYTMNCLHS